MSMHGSSLYSGKELNTMFGLYVPVSAAFKFIISKTKKLKNIT